jgi:FixJ family two-component response regulator
VDDDPAVSRGLCRLLRSAGYDPKAYGSAKEFMKEYRADTPACLVLDISMPDMTGLELQHWLRLLGSPVPVVFLTGCGDIPMSVRAMQEGAVDFLTKPVREAALFKAVEEGLRRSGHASEEWAKREDILARIATLTPREREVLEHVVSGQMNKQVAADLGAAERTIKAHRARVMQKMGVQSLAELARLAFSVGIGAGHFPGPAFQEPASPPNHPPSAP